MAMDTLVIASGWSCYTPLPMLPRLWSVPLIAASLSFVAGCAAERVTALRTPPRPVVARAASEVEVFMTGAPGRPYVDVALLEVSGLYTPGAWVTATRELAAKNGCDGVVLEQQPVAVCIVYSVPLLPPPPAPPPPPVGSTTPPSVGGAVPAR
jgi:hypothetical protein